MSFWAPYADGALDLTKRAVTIKAEPQPPEAQVTQLPVYPQAQVPMYRIDHQVPGLSMRLSPDSTMYGEYPMPVMLSPQSSPTSVTSSRSSPEATRAPRPFKAVTRGLQVTECNGAEEPDTRYAAFRAAMLEAVRARNGGTLCVSNPRMRRAVRRSKDSPDEEYLQRRARNNAAAKKSRDLRRLKEDELAIRTAFLEAENRRLRVELDAMRDQLAHYHAARV